MLENRLCRLHEADELRLHQLMAQHDFRLVGRIVIFAAFNRDLEIVDTVDRHRMRHHIGTDVAQRDHRLLGELLEQVQHALAGLSGGGEEFDRRLVGGSLQGARIAQDQALGEALRSHHDAAARLGDLAVTGHRPTGDGGGPDQHADDRNIALASDFVLHAGQMAAGDMTGFVGQNADHLIRCLRLAQKAGIDEDALATGHEGINARIIDKVDMH